MLLLKLILKLKLKAGFRNNVGCPLWYFTLLYFTCCRNLISYHVFLCHFISWSGLLHYVTCHIATLCAAAHQSTILWQFIECSNILSFLTSFLLFSLLFLLMLLPSFTALFLLFLFFLPSFPTISFFQSIDNFPSHYTISISLF